MFRTLLTPVHPRVAAASIVVAACLGALHAPAGAQAVRPWSPPGDTLSPLVNSAMTRFQRQQGDSVTGANYDPFQIVGRLGQNLFAALGRTRLAEAPSIETTLRAAGLDVQVAVDRETPQVAFMLVRNPFRRTSGAVGFLYWLRERDVKQEGATFPPSRDPVLRAWLTGRPEAPYEAAILYQREGKDAALAMRLFRMEPGAQYWNLIQYDGHGPQFSPAAHASFTDVNADGVPELVGYDPFEPDSFFVIRGGMPPTVQEHTYTERPEGFVLHDLRAVPGPTETLRLFTLLLADHQEDRARRLLLRPASLDSVLALGWGKHNERGAWTVEYGEPGQAWPEWLELRVHQDSGFKRWIFHFWIQDGRWVIKDWIPVRPPQAPRVAIPPADSTGVKRP